MLKRLSVTAMLVFAAGCAGDSFKPNKIISDIQPNYIASGRTKQVEIHGDFTKWKESTIEVGDISFGDDITIDAVTVANEGFLLVTITAAGNAVAGPRDVEVDGENLNGVFMVRPPFELDVTDLSPGGFAVLSVIGTDTDWIDGLTTLQGDGLLTNGNDIFGVTSTTVIAQNFLQAVVQVDLFATAGPAEVTINGLTATDSDPNALTITALTTTNLTTPTSTTLSIANGLSCTVLLFESGTAGQVQLTELTAGTAAPYAFIVDPDLGYAQSYATIFEDFGDSFIAFGPREKFLFADGAKALYAVVFDADSLDEFLNDGILPTPDPIDFDLDYNLTGGPVVAGTPQTALTLQQSGDMLARFYTPGLTPWSLVTASVTTPNVASTLDAVLEVHRDGTNGNRSLRFQSGIDEIGVFVNGRSLGSFIAVTDLFASASGATSEFDLSVTAAALAGTLTDAGVVNMTIPDDNSGEITDTVMPATGFTTVTAVHLALDISHGFESDLSITLESPSGEIFSFAPGDFGDDGTEDGGLLTVYPDIDDATVAMADLLLETNPDGTWTLHVEDTYGDFGDYGIGVLNGWAISIEGS